MRAEPVCAPSVIAKYVMGQSAPDWPPSPPGRLPVFDRYLLAAITYYQGHLSPQKGFRCPYGVLHGGSGCSGYAAQVIREYGWRLALPLVRNRFRACRRASITMRLRRAGATDNSTDSDPNDLFAPKGDGSNSSREKPGHFRRDLNNCGSGCLEAYDSIECLCQPCDLVQLALDGASSCGPDIACGSCHFHEAICCCWPW